MTAVIWLSWWSRTSLIVRAWRLGQSAFQWIVAIESPDVTISSAENDDTIVSEEEYDEEEHFAMEYEEWENNLIDAASDEEDVNDDNSSIDQLLSSIFS